MDLEKKFSLPVHLFCKGQEQPSEILYVQFFFYLWYLSEDIKPWRMELANPDTKLKKNLSKKSLLIENESPEKHSDLNVQRARSLNILAALTQKDKR